MRTITDEPIYLGATPKYLLNIDAGTLGMDEYDFQVRLQRGPNSVTIEKNEMIVDGEGHHFICVDTTALGVGPVRASVIADIPDADYPTGVRTEICVIENFANILPL